MKRIRGEKKGEEMEQRKRNGDCQWLGGEVRRAIYTKTVSNV